MTRKQILPGILLFAFVLILIYAQVALTQAPVGTSTVAAQAQNDNRLTWQIPAEYGGASLTLSGVDGFYVQREFSADTQPAMQLTDDNGAPLPDGQYTYELRFKPVITAVAAAAMEEGRHAADRGALMAQLEAEGAISAAAPSLAGTFTLQNGVLVTEQAEPSAAQSEVENNNPLVPDVFVHAEDVIVQGSLCTGDGCVSGEVFGADTLRLKENNLRIHFEDNSASGSFPGNDWRIVINDQANFGANYFAVENSTSFVVPFKITDSAIANNLFVTEAAGSGNLPRIGVGTAAPQTSLELIYADTATMRLHQDNSQGWGEYIWDVAGNETNFFIRDVTNSSSIPFKIQPGAANSSILIRNNGHIGIMPGTSNAGFPAIDQTLYVLAADATFRVQNSTTGAVTLDLDSGGNLTLNGLLTEASDRALKENVQPVNNQTVLDTLAGLPINTWNYISDRDDIRHMGPMAQDFYAAFGLGADDRHIAPLDANGVALAGVQELYGRLQAQESQITALEQENADLEQRLADLETAVSALLAAQEK